MQGLNQAKADLQGFDVAALMSETTVLKYAARGGSDGDGGGDRLVAHVHEADVGVLVLVAGRVLADLAALAVVTRDGGLVEEVVVWALGAGEEEEGGPVQRAVAGAAGAGEVGPVQREVAGFGGHVLAAGADAGAGDVSFVQLEAVALVLVPVVGPVPAHLAAVAAAAWGEDLPEEGDGVRVALGDDGEVVKAVKNQLH